MIKKIINLLTPPLFRINLWKSKICQKDKINKFNYENNLYSRHSFIIKSIIKTFLKKKKCMYLEIGVSMNAVFNTIPLPLNNKIGVDPFSGGTHRMTSDDFFKKNKKKFDVIFIDGLHTYKQCQKDFLNSINFLNNDGIIIFHDFLPRNHIEGSAIRKSKDWCGDIWKLAVEINQSLEKDFVIVNIDMGVGLFKPKKKFMYKKINELKNKNFDNFINDYKNKLPIVSSEQGLDFI